MAPGGPGRYTGRDLRTPHAGLAGLTGEHVGRVIGHLAQTLRELAAAEDDIAAAGTVAASARDDVLDR
jgi:truncated hemoglobin YjbI